MAAIPFLVVDGLAGTRGRRRRDTAGDVLPAPGAFDAGAVACKPVNRECLYGVSRLALATA